MVLEEMSDMCFCLCMHHTNILHICNYICLLIYVYLYTYMFVCICVCMCVRERNNSGKLCKLLMMNISAEFHHWNFYLQHIYFCFECFIFNIDYISIKENQMKGKHSRLWFWKIKAKFLGNLLEYIQTGAIIQLRLRVRLNPIRTIIQLITLVWA